MGKARRPLLHTVAVPLLWLPLQPTRGYETWHLVDVAAVVCPRPEVPEGATSTALPDYTVGIQYTPDLVVDRPHIFTILRTSSKPVRVQFTVTDSNNKEVIPAQDITLGDLTNASTVSPSCTCTGQKVSERARTSGIDENYGSSCYPWDNANCDGLWGADFVGEYCCKPWCYASAGCGDKYQSELEPGYLWSYAACASTPVASPCNWAPPSETCACRDVSSSFDDETRAKFPNEYGSSCSDWDAGTKGYGACHENYAEELLDNWCCANWCYVGESCPSAVKSIILENVWWSRKACNNDPKTISQCPYQKRVKKTEENLEKCKCLNEAIPADRRPSGTSADWGRTCRPHDKDSCNVTYAGYDMDMWCCTPWCIVSEDCPGARDSIAPGYYFSDLACDIEEWHDEVSSCKFSDACECTGVNTGLPLALVGKGFDPLYGTSCRNWDDEPTGCKALWGLDNWQSDPNVSKAWFVEGGDNAWCCDHWCYVGSECPLAFPSALSENHYSYATCDDNESKSVYDASDDRCKAPAGRRLSSRRRSGYRRGSSISPRRRTPAPARPQRPPDPRRRSVQRPESAQGRRRGVSVTSSSADIRRRAPAQPATALNPRRRTTGLNGHTYSTAGGTNYGYSSKPQMMNNYGGKVPMSTSYGYSGANAYQPTAMSGKKPNVAMYAAGGLAAGAVMGAGAYYLYDSYNRPNYGYGACARNLGGGYYGYGGRRRFSPPEDYQRSFCIVPGTYPNPPEAGDFMECTACRQWHGACNPAEGCYSQGGCGYNLQKPINRDDLAATGFIPKDFAPPLTVKFQNITGEGIHKAEICPPVTEEEIYLAAKFNRSITFSADLFLTLTSQEVLRPTMPPFALPCPRDTGYSCKDGAQPGTVGESACWGPEEECTSDLSCHCIAGYCVEGTGASIVCSQEWEEVNATINAVHRSPLGLSTAFVVLILFFAPRRLVRL